MSKKISNICNDKLKYMLLNCAENATKGPIVPEMYFRARVRVFASMHRFHLCGKKASVKVDHLYVIPYSRYYTLREMLVSTEQEIETDEDDEILKQNFLDMMSNKNHVSSQSLENSFFKEIQALKTPEVFKKYQDLDYRIHHQKLNEDEKLRFIESTAETDIFLAKKLGSDAQKFMSQKESILKFMQDYRFVNGWITASGIALFTLSSSLLSMFNIVF